ncbi:MAG: hypothetical protein ACPG32_14045 [Akkermansiaceae bacterium]
MIDEPEKSNRTENPSFSLEKRSLPVADLSADRQASALSFMRFVTWVAPGPAIVMAFWLLSLLPMFSHAPPHGAFLFLLGVAITMGIGYCNAMLSNTVRKNPNGLPNTGQAIAHAFTFTITQVLIAPAVCLTLLFGFCAVASF